MKLKNPSSEIILENLLEDETTRTMLEMLRMHHLETYQHSIRVALLTLDISQEYDLDTRLAGRAGLIHDIGKVSIPRRILEKPGALDYQERSIVEEHARRGIAGAHRVGRKTRRVMIGHHEHTQRNPYPRKGTTDDRTGDKKERRRTDPIISRTTQILAASDMYDALANQRSYKKPLPFTEVEEILRTQYTGDQQYIDQVLKRATP